MQKILEMVEVEEYRMLRTAAADYALRVLAPVAEELDAVSGTPLLESLNKSAELGVLRALAAEESGGGGLDDYAFCIALEELAAQSAGAATALLIHNAAMLPALKAGAAAEMESIYQAFPLALAYPGDLGLAGGKLSGHAPWAFNAVAASVITVLFSDGAALVDAAGMEVQPLEYQLGLRAARAGSIEVKMAEPLVIIEGGFKRDLDRMLHLGFAAIGIGISRHGFETAYAYASERYQGCDIIIRHEAIRLMLADMASGIEMGRSMLKSACEAGTLASAIACRLETTERALRSATDAVQIHGGYGYMEDYGMERLMRDAQCCQIYPQGNHQSRLELLDLLEGQA